MELSEAKEILKEFYKSTKIDDSKIRLALFSVMYYIENESISKEKNKKLEDLYESLESQYMIDQRMYEKIIDIMMGEIVTHNIPDDFCMRYGKRKKTCKTLDDDEKCKECIREYYFKKARGEEDE